MTLTPLNNSKEMRRQFVYEYRRLSDAALRNVVRSEPVHKPIGDPEWIILKQLQDKKREAYERSPEGKRAKEKSKKAKERTEKTKSSIRVGEYFINEHKLVYLVYDEKTGHSRIKNPRNKRFIDFWNNGTLRCADGSWEKKVNLKTRVYEELKKLI